MSDIVNELRNGPFSDMEDLCSRAAAEVERLRAALDGIMWVSADKDNMEFAARITCFQMDKIRAALKR
jgi:hypothetical protein